MAPFELVFISYLIFVDSYVETFSFPAIIVLLLLCHLKLFAFQKTKDLNGAGGKTPKVKQVSSRSRFASAPFAKGTLSATPVFRVLFFDSRRKIFRFWLPFGSLVPF